MIDDWAGGNDTDGLGGPPLDVARQATLWRHLRERVGVPSPAERLPTARVWMAAGLAAPWSVPSASSTPYDSDQDQLRCDATVSRR